MNSASARTRRSGVFCLRNKLLFYSVALALIPLGIAGNTMTRITRDELKSTANEEIARVAEGLAGEIRSLYRDSWLAPLSLVANAVDSPDLGGEEKISMLRAGLANLNDVVSCQISVIGIPGPVVVSRDDFAGDLIGAGLDPAGVLTVPPAMIESLLENSGGGSTAGRPENVVGTGQWLLTLLVPLERPIAGRPAVLLARVDLGGLKERLENHPFLAAGRIELIDADGLRVLDADRTDLSGLDIVADAVERLRSRSRAIGVRPYHAGDGQAMLAAYAFPDDLDWAVIVERSEEDAYRAVGRMTRNLGLMALGGLALAILGGLIVALRISRPVENVADVAREVGAGNLDVEADEPNRRDEIGDLAVEVNRMIRGLKEREVIRDTFGRFVSPAVAQQVLSDPENLKPGGDLREVTILMSDLRGFTSLSERIAPAEMIELLNDYLGRMADIIDAHGGTVIEFIGDGIMSLFGAPFDHEDDPLRAVACAAAMQEGLESFNEEISARGLPALQMGIGINTGSVIVGNIGNESRMKYGVVGDDVNLCGRVESFTVGGEVLVSESTRKSVGSNAVFRGPIEVQAKGKSGKLELYALVEVGPPYGGVVPFEQQDPQKMRPCSGKVILRKLRGKQVEDVDIDARAILIGYDDLEIECPHNVEVFDDFTVAVTLDEPGSVELADLYGKATSVTQIDDGYRCTIRLTSVPGAARDVISSLFPV